MQCIERKWGMFHLLIKSKILFYSLVFIPPFYIGYLINLYSINIPFWDQWIFIDLLKKAHTGILTFHDFFGQHNEHRILFPRLIMLVLALLTNWNIMYELYTNILIAGFTLFFLYSILRQTIDRHLVPAITVVFSLLIFSPVQGINWTWGWQLQIFLSVLGTVIAVWSVNCWPGKLRGIVIAIIFSVVSSFSFNNGLLTWVIVTFFLMLQSKKKNYLVSLYILSAFITIFLYYTGYTKPPYHPSLLLPLIYPFDYFQYVLVYIGSPCGVGKRAVSMIIGLISIIIFFAGAIALRRFNREKFNKLLPWVTLGWYALLSACVTGVGRLGFGVNQALSSRYTTISVLFIISTIVITISWINNFRDIHRGLPKKLIVAVTFISTLLALTYVLSFSLGLKEMKQKKAEIKNAEVCLYDEVLATDECLKVIYPEPTLVRGWIKMFKEMDFLKEKK